MGGGILEVELSWDRWISRVQLPSSIFWNCLCVSFLFTPILIFSLMRQVFPYVERFLCLLVFLFLFTNSYVWKELEDRAPGHPQPGWLFFLNSFFCHVGTTYNTKCIKWATEHFEKVLFKWLFSVSAVTIAVRLQLDSQSSQSDTWFILREKHILFQSLLWA